MSSHRFQIPSQLGLGLDGNNEDPCKTLKLNYFIQMLMLGHFVQELPVLPPGRKRPSVDLKQLRNCFH